MEKSRVFVLSILECGFRSADCRLRIRNPQSEIHNFPITRPSPDFHAHANHWATHRPRAPCV
jgi:hypothetical protein